MSVNGWIDARRMGFILPHEHVLVDFIGADKVSKERYNTDEVYNVALPFILDAKKAGCSALMECTPAYLGRDPQLLQRLSDASGLSILTNTGYYGAVNEKYLPAEVKTKTAVELANGWIAEFQYGIAKTRIKPGFIKLGVDKAPLSPSQQKIVHAGAITHLETGLTICIHTGNGAAAEEELQIINSHEVSANALVWVHAQNEKDFDYFKRLGDKGCWIEFDGLNKDNLQQYLQFLQFMKSNNLLNKVLISHDSGWYHVGEPNGGKYNGYTCLFTNFIPLLQKNGFSQKEIDQVFKLNPVNAFGVQVRKI